MNTGESYFITAIAWLVIKFIEFLLIESYNEGYEPNEGS